MGTFHLIRADRNRPRGLWRLAVFSTLAASLIATGPQARGQQAQGEQEPWVILIDCSGTMFRKAYAKGSSSYYDLAVEWVMDEVKVRLPYSAVRIVPFEETFRDYSTGRVFRPENEQDIDNKVRDIQQYLARYAPQNDRRGKSVWDKIDQVIADNHLTSLSHIVVCTSRETDIGGRKPQAGVERELRTRWGMPPGAPLPIQRYDVDPTGPAPPHVGAYFFNIKSGKITLSPADFASGPKMISLPLTLQITGHAGANDGLTSVRAILREQKSPPLTIDAQLVSSGGPSPSDGTIIRNGSAGSVQLALKGDFSSLDQTVEYDFYIELDFLSRAVGLAGNLQRQVLRTTRPWQLTVSPAPVITMAIQQDGPLALFPDKPGRFKIALQGNSSARGQRFELEATPRIQGVTVDFYPIEQEANKDAVKQHDKFQSEWPEQSSMELWCEIRADHAMTQAVSLSSRIFAHEDRKTIILNVVTPHISANLRTPGAQPVELADALPAASKLQPLNCGPIEFNTDLEADAKNVQVLITALDQKDIELGFSLYRDELKPSDFKASITSSLAELKQSGIAVWAKWKVLPPSQKPKLPRVKIELVGSPGFKVDLNTGELGLEGMVKLKSPDFWVEAEPGTERPVTLHSQAKHTRVVTLHWNSTAIGQTLNIATIPPADGWSIDNFKALTGLEMPTPTTIKLSGDNLQGQFQFDITAPEIKNRTSVKCGITLAMEGQAVSGQPRLLEFPYELLPYVLAVDVVIEPNIELYDGGETTIGTITASSDGLDGRIKASVRSEGNAVPLTVGFRDNSSAMTPERAVATSGNTFATLRARPVAGNKRDTKLRGTLLIEPVLPPGSSIKSLSLQRRSDGNVVSRIEVPFEYQVRSWSLVATYQGKPCTQLPPQNRLLVGSDTTLRTSSDFVGKFRLDIPPSCKLPSELLKQDLEAVVSDNGTGKALRNVEFELDSGEKRPTIKLADLPHVKGLVLTTSNVNLLGKWTTQYPRGRLKVKLKGDDTVAVAMDVLMQVDGPIPYGKIILIAAITLAATMFGVKKLKQARKGAAVTAGASQFPPSDPKTVDDVDRMPLGGSIPSRDDAKEGGATKDSKSSLGMSAEDLF